MEVEAEETFYLLANDNLSDAQEGPVAKYKLVEEGEKVVTEAFRAPKEKSIAQE